MTAKSHPASMRFIPDSTAEKALEKNNSLDILSQQPSRYVAPSFLRTRWAWASNCDCL